MQDKLLLVNLLISFAYQLHVAFFIYLNIFYVFIKFLCIFFSFKCNPCDTVFSRCFKMLLTLSNVADVNTQIGNVWFEIVRYCFFKRWLTQHCFNVDLRFSDVAVSYQWNSNVAQHWKASWACAAGNLTWRNWVSEESIWN